MLEELPTPSHTFVATIDLKLADKLLADLQEQGFEIYTPAEYQFFS